MSSWKQEDAKLRIGKTLDGAIQILDESQPMAPVPGRHRGPEQELHWAFCTGEPCGQREGGGVWFLAEDGGMYGYHRGHLSDEDLAEVDAFREQYKAKYLSE